MKKIALLLTLSAITLLFWRCESLDDLTKSPLMRGLDDIQHEWTVDSIRYTRYNLDGSIYSDSIRPTGKMTFGELQDNPPKNLIYHHGFVIHKYQERGVAKIDTTAWSYGVDSDIKIKYVNIFYKDPSDNSFTAGKTIYDVKELSSNAFYLYRFEMLVDVVTGNTYGRATSIIKMHR